MYSQPFCIIGSKGKFRGASGNYLPPLEPFELPPGDINEIVRLNQTITKLQQQIYQLQGQIAYFSNKFVRKSNIKFVRKPAIKKPGYQGLRERREE